MSALGSSHLGQVTLTFWKLKTKSSFEPCHIYFTLYLPMNIIIKFNFDKPHEHIGTPESMVKSFISVLKSSPTSYRYNICGR